MLSGDDQQPAHRPMPMLQADFARRINRARSTISELLKPNGALAAARLDGGRIDAASPVVAAWAVARGIDLERLMRLVREDPKEVSDGRAHDVDPELSDVVEPASNARGEAALMNNWPVRVDAYLDFTLREVYVKFGSVQALSEVVLLRKRMADTAAKEISNHMTMGALVPREYVRVHVFAHLQALHDVLLRDFARTVTIRVYSEARGGVSLEDAERQVRDMLGDYLAETKRQVIAALKQHTVTTADESKPE